MPPISYPTGAEVRAWAGAVTSTSFSVNADFTQSVGSVAVQVSTNSDMSNPVYTSGYSQPTVSTGAVLSYHTAAFSVAGLSPATTYYWRLLYLPAASQGGAIRSLKTAPVGAGAFSFALGSCSDIARPKDAPPTIFAAPVFRSIAADAPNFFLHMGDITYSDISTVNIGLQRDGDARAYRNSLDVDVMHRSVPIMYQTSDHDMGPNDCSLDTPNGAAIFANTRTVYGETVPGYPLALNGLLTQVATYGLTRFLLLDAYSQSTYLGFTALGATQMAWLAAQLTQAAADGMKWVFIAQGRTWTGAVFNGFGDSFTAERAAICDLIEECAVPVCMLVGDAHACALDDGTNTGFSTDGFAFFPQILASALLQDPMSLSGPYSWNGSSLYFHTVRSMYGLVTMSADNTTWTANIKGNPIDPSTFAPTTLATVSSTDVTPAVSFSNAAPTVAHGTPLTVNLNKTWFGACSVHWASSDGQSGNVTFKPNKKRASFAITFVSAGSPTITLSSPSGCTISGTNPATVTVT